MKPRLTKEQLKPGVSYSIVTDTGLRVVGTNERLYATANVMFAYIENGVIEPEYVGDTDLDWNSQTTVKSVNPKTGKKEREWDTEGGGIVWESDLRFIEEDEE